MDRKLNRFLNRSLDAMSLKERQAVAGQWMATQLYSPQTLPLRTIQALGESAEDCIRQLTERGLDPVNYFYEWIPAAVEM